MLFPIDVNALLLALQL